MKIRLKKKSQKTIKDEKKNLSRKVTKTQKSGKKRRKKPTNFK